MHDATCVPRGPLRESAAAHQREISAVHSGKDIMSILRSENKQERTPEQEELLAAGEPLQQQQITQPVKRENEATQRSSDVPASKQENSQAAFNCKYTSINGSKVDFKSDCIGQNLPEEGNLPVCVHVCCVDVRPPGTDPFLVPLVPVLSLQSHQLIHYC